MGTKCFPSETFEFSFPTVCEFFFVGAAKVQLKKSHVIAEKGEYEVGRELIAIVLKYKIRRNRRVSRCPCMLMRCERKETAEGWLSAAVRKVEVLRGQDEDEVSDKRMFGMCGAMG